MTTPIGLLHSNRKFGLCQKATLSSPATGVKSDLEKLLTRFTETNSVRYEEFAELWRDMKMSLIFAGRQTDAECREFLEDSYRIAVQFFLPPYNFQVRVGALYILYALYVKQPCTPVVQIRLLPSEFSELHQFLEEVQQQQHLDVEYVYHFLLYHRAFSLVATPLPMFPMMREVTGDDPQITAKQDMLLEQKSILSEIMESENIDQLSAIHEQYHRTKCLLSGGRNQPKTSLNVIKSSLVQYITKSVAAHEEKRKHIVGKKSRKRHDSGQTTTSESEPESDGEGSEGARHQAQHGGQGQVGQKREGDSQVGQRRAAIKARAFAGVEKASRSRRHRQAVTESSHTDDSPGPALLSPPARKRKSTASTTPGVVTEQLGEDPDLAQLNVQLKQSLLSMPSLTDFQDGPSPKQKKTGRGARKGSPKKAEPGKKQRRASRKKLKTKALGIDRAVKVEKSSEEEVMMSPGRESSGSPGHSHHNVKHTGKRMPKIVMKGEKTTTKKAKRNKLKKKDKGSNCKQVSEMELSEDLPCD